MIKKIANLVDPQHKVNLGAPDKVILIDIYQAGSHLTRYPNRAKADLDDRQHAD